MYQPLIQALVREREAKGPGVQSLSSIQVVQAQSGGLEPQNQNITVKEGNTVVTH